MNNVPLTKKTGTRRGEGVGQRRCTGRFIGLCAGKHEGKTKTKARRPVRRPFAVSSKGCSWFGPKSGNRGGETLSDTRFFFFF